MEYGEKSFERFFRSNYLPMFRMAFSLLENEEDAKHAVSQVFMMLWQNKPQIADKLMESYLRTAIHNECVHIQRKRMLRWEVEEESVHTLDSLMVEGSEESLHREVGEAIEDHLSEENKRILELHYGEGLSYAETAEEMGTSHSFVHHRVKKILKEMRTLFNRRK